MAGLGFAGGGGLGTIAPSWDAPSPPLTSFARVARRSAGDLHNPRGGERRSARQLRFGGDAGQLLMSVS